MYVQEREYILKIKNREIYTHHNKTKDVPPSNSNFSKQLPSSRHFDSADPTACWTGRDAAFATIGIKYGRVDRNALLLFLDGNSSLACNAVIADEYDGNILSPLGLGANAAAPPANASTSNFMVNFKK